MAHGELNALPQITTLSEGVVQKKHKLLHSAWYDIHTCAHSYYPQVRETGANQLLARSILCKTLENIHFEDIET